MKQLESPEYYTIGWIAALPLEFAAAKAMLEENHRPPEGFEQNPSDDNLYTWGRVGVHNIVLALLPSGTFGVVAAAHTVAQLMSSLPHIRIGLLVGIGGGIPQEDRDIRLGDVVVSNPQGTSGGVVQFDMGKVKRSGTWEPIGSLHKPPRVLRQAVSNLQAQHMIEDSKIPQVLQSLWERKPKMQQQGNDFTYQGVDNDLLFATSYDHSGDATCAQCDRSKTVERIPRDTTDPVIHYGTIASGNQLVKSSEARQHILEIAKDSICVEMEAAGLMDDFPCLVIRGICDYADSHKNDRWQKYAAAAAAAYAVELLEYVPTKELKETKRAIDVVKDVSQKIDQLQSTAEETKGNLKTLRETQESKDFYQVVNTLHLQKQPDTGEMLQRMIDSPPTWILDEKSFCSWQKQIDDSQPPELWVVGEPGVGKSHLLTFLFDYFQVYTSDQTTEETLAGSCTDKAPDRLSDHAQVAIYYCKYNSNDNEDEFQCTNRIFQCLLRQILETTPLSHLEDNSSLVADIKRIVNPRVTFGQTSALSLLQQISPKLGRVYLFIDGLDELPGSCYRRLVQQLRSLCSPSISLIFSCRRGCAAFQPTERMQVVNADNNEGTIERFILGQVKAMSTSHILAQFGGHPEEPRVSGSIEEVGKLCQSVVTAANRNFLAAYLIINHVMEADSADIHIVLKDLSGGLGQLVKRLIERINNLPDEERRVGRTTLNWVIYARDASLTFKQLQQALSYSLYSNKDHTEEFTRSRLTKATSYFLSFGAESDCVLIHKTLKEYCEKGKIHQDYQRAHAIMAKACLGCLRDYDARVHSLCEWEDAVHASPLISYAASNWGWHQERARDVLPNEPFPTLNLMSLLRDSETLCLMTYGILPEIRKMDVWGRWIEVPLSTMHILAFFNLFTTAEELMCDKYRLTGSNTSSPSALYIAAVRGNTEMVAYLMSIGASPVEAQLFSGHTPFLAAVQSRHKKTVASMIKLSHPEQLKEMMSTKGKGGLYPLSIACGNIGIPGSVEIVKIILQVIETMPDRDRIFFNHGGRKGKTALHLAAEANDPQIIKSLLGFKNGRGRNLLTSRNDLGATALVNAGTESYLGTADTIKLLLEQPECDPLSQDHQGRTALHETAYHEERSDPTRVEAFKALLPRSDLSIQDMDGNTPLHLSCDHGRHYHVVAMVPSLVENPSLCHIKNNKGYTPIYLAAAPAKNPADVEMRAFNRRMKSLECLIPIVRDHISQDDAQLILDTSLKYDQGTVLGLILDLSPKARSLFERDQPPLQKAVLSGGGSVVGAVLARTSTADFRDRGIERGVRTKIKSTLQWCTELCDETVVKTIWARARQLLEPAEVTHDVLGLASARNPVRMLWQKEGFLPQQQSRQVECLHAERSDVDCQGYEAPRRQVEGLPPNIGLASDEQFYLQSEPIPATAKIPISNLRFSVTSQDQGWSDWAAMNPQDVGTIRGSFTWFTIAIKRDGQILKESEIVRNLLNLERWITFEVIWDGNSGASVIQPENTVVTSEASVSAVRSFIHSIRRGDRICVTATARFPGWVCHTKHASVRVYYDD